MVKFFGHENLTIAIPMRSLANRRAVDEADLNAASRLRSFLEHLGLTVTLDFVNPDGSIDLTTPGLIVICGPKSSDDVAHALATDPRFQFVKRESQWVIHDALADMEYESPMDVDGSDVDIAYIARARRKAGSRHSFISIAGIHSAGSAVAVDFLSSVKNLRELLKGNSVGPFSLLVSGDFSRAPFVVHESSRLS
ncbi:hypothetical protein [Corynebacterium cystitidis]|uniref:hypothetical protein n=1 Tax=Corynebacterium cystitidis TaxID=35757 RepID=UPI000B885024|nr:hypothetical protein [Corynebacterium cystitidis]